MMTTKKSAKVQESGNEPKICKACGEINGYYEVVVTKVVGQLPAAHIGDRVIFCDQCDSIMKWTDHLDIKED